MIENWAGSEVSMDRVCSGLIWCCTHLSVPVQGAWDRGLSLWPDTRTCSDVYTDLCIKTKNTFLHLQLHFWHKLLSLAQCGSSGAGDLGSCEKDYTSYVLTGRSLVTLKGALERQFWSLSSRLGQLWEVSCVSVTNECWVSLWPWPLLQDAIEAIAESAFKTSPYPVILSFENHVDSWVFGDWENCLSRAENTQARAAGF